MFAEFLTLAVQPVLAIEPLLLNENSTEVDAKLQAHCSFTLLTSTLLSYQTQWLVNGESYGSYVVQEVMNGTAKESLSVLLRGDHIQVAEPLASVSHYYLYNNTCIRNNDIKLTKYRTY